MVHQRQITEKRFWDKVAHRYDGFMLRFAREYPGLISLILNELKPDDEVLEIACGTGIISLEISYKVKQVYATDISSSMIKIAIAKAEQKEIDNIRFSVQDGYSLNFENHKFDVCIVANALHIIQEPEKVLQEVKRVLKPEGLLIAPTYCHAENLKARLVSRIMSLTGFKAYHKFTVISFLSFVERSGYIIVKKQIIRDGFPMVYLVARPISII